MAKNRKYQSAAVRFGPALKAFLLCAVIGGSGVGYVWQKSQIDAKGLVGHVAAAVDLAGQILGCALRQTGDDAEAAGVRDGSRHLGITDVMHAALDDRMPYSKEFGDARSH
jgi:hypothetical protein